MIGLAIPRLFTQGVINEVIIDNKPGVYVLGNDKCGFDYKYVGRSDTSLKRRLLSHNYLYQYEYFIYTYSNSPKEAFYLECKWWHDCMDYKIVNKIHPASPKGSKYECPYCHFAQYIDLSIAV